MGDRDRGLRHVRVPAVIDGKRIPWFPVGFANRKSELTLYLSGGQSRPDLSCVERLGPHRVGGGCLYVKRLADVDPAVLRELIAAAYAAMAGSETPAG